MEHERLYTLGKPKACPIIRSGVGSQFEPFFSSSTPYFGKGT
jgi:hypothetical protein